MLKKMAFERGGGGSSQGKKGRKGGSREVY